MGGGGVHGKIGVPNSLPDPPWTIQKEREGKGKTILERTRITRRIPCFAGSADKEITKKKSKYIRKYRK